MSCMGLEQIPKEIILICLMEILFIFSILQFSLKAKGEIYIREKSELFCATMSFHVSVHASNVFCVFR